MNIRNYFYSVLNYIRAVYTHLYTSQEHIYFSWISFFFFLPRQSTKFNTDHSNSQNYFQIPNLLTTCTVKLPSIFVRVLLLFVVITVVIFLSLCCCSVIQLCPTVCNPMNCSTPGFPISHHLLELAQTRSIELVIPYNHLVLCHPFCLSQHQSLFQWVSSS